jgi:hypothetical protein
VSIPTFYLPAIDTVVEPLPSCVGDGPPAYEAITPYEWEAIFIDRTRKRLAKAGIAY